jgi:hypothetical protein
VPEAIQKINCSRAPRTVAVPMLARVPSAQALRLVRSDDLDIGRRQHPWRDRHIAANRHGTALDAARRSVPSPHSSPARETVDKRSFASLTTVGYGEVVPIEPFARSMAMLEALVGQMFPSILLAHHPLASNGTPQERARNRRTEILLRPQ